MKIILYLSTSPKYVVKISFEFRPDRRIEGFHIHKKYLKNYTERATSACRRS
jgi:hypothetical protein